MEERDERQGSQDGGRVDMKEQKKRQIENKERGSQDGERVY